MNKLFTFIGYTFSILIILPRPKGRKIGNTLFLFDDIFPRFCSQFLKSLEK